MISVVIPLYNKELSVERTLRSVLEQTYKDFEIIVVDDGSTDGSALVVESFIDNRIRLIRKTNGGVSSARNRGIQEAKGSHVAFLDGDDCWEPNYLEELVKLIKDYPDAAIYGLGHGIMQGNEKHTIDKKNLPEGFRGVVENVWTSHPYYWTGSSSSSSSYRLRKVGGFDERMTHGEDLDMWWRLMLDGRAVYYDKTLAYYVQDSENRAMNKLIPLEKHIPNYIDKFAAARKENPDFRAFFDEEMARRLYPYLLDRNSDSDRKKARQLVKKLDCTSFKFSLRFRLKYPRLYFAYFWLKKIFYCHIEE